MFMILEGVMIVLATGCLTLLHPAVCFQGAWHEVNFNYRTKKGHSKVMSLSEEEGMTDIELSNASLTHNLRR